jgi:hypothetical protein
MESRLLDSGQSTLHHKTQLEKTLPLLPPNHKKKKKRGDPFIPCFHDMTSHWLHEKFIFSKIGCHYFWPGPNSPSYEHPTYPILFYSSKAQKVEPSSVDAFVLTFNCLLLATNSKHLPLQNNPPIS